MNTKVTPPTNPAPATDQSSSSTAWAELDSAFEAADDGHEEAVVSEESQDLNDEAEIDTELTSQDETSEEPTTEEAEPESEETAAEDEGEDEEEGKSDEETPPEEEPVKAEPTDPAAVREAWVQSVESRYTVSEDLADSLRVEPEKVLPKLLAQVHVAVAEEVIQAMAANLPDHMRKISVQDKAAADAESAFYKKWPKLRDKKFTKDIMEVTSIYRQKNPSASLDDAINKVGALVSVQYGLPIKFDQDEESLSEERPRKTQAMSKGLTTQPRAETRQAPAAKKELNFFEQWGEEILTGLDE